MFPFFKLKIIVTYRIKRMDRIELQHILLFAFFLYLKQIANFLITHLKI